MSEGKKKFPVNEKPKMMSLDELRKQGGSDDDERNSYYAGGEKSGMAIEGADKPQLSAVKKLLEQAQKNSLEREKWSDEEETEEKGYFTGHGHRLSDQTNEASTSTSSASPPQNTQKKVTRTITFWKNGFTFSEHGPLYDYENAENQRTLALMQAGQVPLKVLDLAPGQSVDMQVIHRISEEFVPIEKPKMPFEGKGNRLGDMVDPSSTVSPSFSAPTGTSEIDIPRFDVSLPQTTLQLRFSNGTKKTLTLNTNFTIKELHEYAQTVANLSGSITLLHGRPPAPLNPTDESTLQQSGLLNTVVIQQ